MFFRLGLIAALIGLPAFAHEKIQIQSMQEIRALKPRLTADAGKTLFVFDIDNTLIKTKQDLASDAWFSWQEKLLLEKPLPADAVAADREGLFLVLNQLYAFSEFTPAEPGTPELIRELQTAGHPIILLTSRGDDLEYMTQRELARSGIDIQSSALAPRAGFAAPFIPYDLNDPEKSCLTKADVAKLGLGPARPVIYRQGTVLTAGQHKGAMLRTLLCKLNKTFEKIVFVDDHQRHVDRVYAAYEDQPGEVFSLRYGYLDPQVKAFNDGDKSQVRRQWQQIRDLTRGIFN